jgi:hypothetical protein
MKLPPCIIITIISLSAIFTTVAQTSDTGRLRELREKARNSSLTPEEKAELDAAMKARNAGKTVAPPAVPATPASPKPETGKPMTPSANSPQRDAAMKEQRIAQYAERQEFSLERMRQMGKAAIEAAAA